MKPDLSNLTGKQLFDFYTSQNNGYKGVLFTAYEHIGDELFKMLETAEKEGKTITLIETREDVNDPPITVTIK